MKLVQDHEVNAFQEWVVVETRRENSLSHDHQFGVLRSPIIKANLISDLIAQPNSELRGNSRSYRPSRNSTRLEEENPAVNVGKESGRQTCGLAGAGRCLNDERLIVSEFLDDLLDDLIHRQGLHQSGISSSSRCRVSSVLRYSPKFWILYPEASMERFTC